MIDPTNEIGAPEPPKALLAPPPGTTPAEPRKLSPPAKPPRRTKLWLYLILILALSLGAYLWFRGPGTPATQKTTKSGKGKKGGAPATTPVVAVHATKGNIGVYVTGLGAITPIYTV